MSFLTKHGLLNNSILSEYFNPKNIKQLLLGAGLSLYTLYNIYLHLRWKYKNSIVMKMASDVLAKRNQMITNFSTDGLDVDYILSRDVAQLRQDLIDSKFTSVDLVNVFGDRCQRIGRALNLSAEENFQEALELAKKKDILLEEMKKSGSLADLPPMHGIPFSVKESLCQVGKLSTTGCAYLCDEVMKEDAVVVQQYLNAGGIPLVRGNVPQMMFSLHSKNPIWGEA